MKEGIRHALHLKIIDDNALHFSDIEIVRVVAEIFPFKVLGTY